MVAKLLLEQLGLAPELLGKLDEDDEGEEEGEFVEN
jgi:hypothetical protein